MELNSHKVSVVSDAFFILSPHFDICMSVTIDNYLDL